MIKLILSIRSLDIGGAERQFIELVRHIDKKRFDVTVCTMYGGSQEEEVRSLPGVEYHNLHKKGRYDLFSFLKAYATLLREKEPDVIYSFLGEMNLFSLWASFLVRKKPRIIWGFRASEMNLKLYGKLPQMIFWLQKLFSGKVDLIISNSQASVDFHRAKGFAMERSSIIPNGIDTKRFTRDLVARKAFRKSHCLAEGDIAIGICARMDPMKGYPILAEAAKKILEIDSRVRFFATGREDDAIKRECQQILGKSGERFFWLGEHRRMEELYSGWDIAVSPSSFGEGFSNAIAEAMSCGLPCVVTDVGDSRMIVGECGVVVEPRNVQSLYEGIKTMISRTDRVHLGEMAAKRIRANFSIERMVEATQEAIERTVACAE